MAYEKLAEELCSASQFSNVETARDKFIREPFQNKFEQLRTTLKISGRFLNDDCYFLTTNYEQVFTIVSEMSLISIPIQNFDFIPVSVAIDYLEIESPELPPMVSNNIIISLKNDLISKYKDYFKAKNFESIKTSSLVCSESYYNNIDNLEEEHFQKITIRFNSHPIYLGDLGHYQKHSQLITLMNELRLPKRYDRIDDLYVYPLIFGDIISHLENNRVVFITGSGESGKTYTAIRIIWELHRNRGLKGKYVSGTIENERRASSKNLVNLLDEKYDNHVIYFEDPFGKYKYERNEELERHIASCIASVKRNENLYVIITSREEVFQEFESKRFSEDLDLSKFNVKLSVKNGYDYDKRKLLLTSLAKVRNCKWMSIEKVKNALLACLLIESKLPTPLNIRDFCIQSSEITDLQTLSSLKELKSVETIQSYAQEVNEMTDEKKIFLLYPLISEGMDLNLIKEKYNSVLSSIGKPNNITFEKVLESFSNGDKIDIVNVGDSKTMLNFSHPSYSNALENLIVEKGFYNADIAALFTRVINSLLDVVELKPRLVNLISYYFDLMSQEARQWLFHELNQQGAIVKVITGSIANKNYKAAEDIIPFVGNEAYLLLLAASKKSLPSEMSKFVDDIFDWNVVWQYILSIETKEMIIISNRVTVLCNFDLTTRKTEYLKFRQKLLKKVLENKIKRGIRDSMKTLNELLDMLENDSDLSIVNTALRSKFGSDEVTKIVNALCYKDYMFLSTYRNPGYYKPTTKLLREIPPADGALTYDKVFEILDLYFDASTYEKPKKERAYIIAEKIRPYVQGRSPKGVAAGVLNYMKKNREIFPGVDYIAQICKVNPATVIQMYKAVKMLEKYFAEP